MATTEMILIASLGLLAIISLVIALKALSLAKQTRNKLTENEQQLSKLKHKSELQKEELHEVRSGALAVGNKVKELMVKTDQLADKLQDIEYLDPEARMYSQAAKMVDNGATVEELMQECELPRAEAELLLSLKKSQ